jgi:hypothetical protein
VFILVIPYNVDETFMKVICKSATELLKFLQRLMRRKTTTYTMNAAHALVNGELHIFGGYSDTYKVLFY